MRPRVRLARCGTGRRAWAGRLPGPVALLDGDEDWPATDPEATSLDDLVNAPAGSPDADAVTAGAHVDTSAVSWSPGQEHGEADEVGVMLAEQDRQIGADRLRPAPSGRRDAGGGARGQRMRHAY
jgi:hypothetical protein